MANLSPDILINAFNTFFTPTCEASIPEIVGEERYVKALWFSRVAVDIEAFAAPMIAGIVYLLIVGVAFGLGRGSPLPHEH